MIHVLVATTPLYGHVAPLCAIAADLVDRGMDVTFLTGSQFGESVSTTGARFVAFPDEAVMSEQQFLAYQAERVKLPGGPPQLDLDVQRLFLAPMAAQHRAVQEQLARLDPEDPVVVLHDTTFTGMWPILLGAPGHRPTGTIGIGVTPLTLSSVDTAPFGMALPPDASDAGRARNIAANAAVHDMFAPSVERARELLDDLGATSEPPFLMDAMVGLPDLFL